jgi:hypothetical protein
MLLAAGVLAALAFSALPSVAAAGEFTADCGSGATCTGTVESTGITTLGSANLAIECTSTTGTTSQTSGSSTGSSSLIFKGCRDEIFNGSCTNTGVAGEIKNNTMVSHLIYLEKDKSKKGVLLTNANTTFECLGGFVKRTVTGSIIGEIENPECGIAKTHHTITFTQASKGQQTWKQITTEGTVFDLIANNDAGGAYETASQVGTAHINYTGGNTVKMTC